MNVKNLRMKEILIWKQTSSKRLLKATRKQLSIQQEELSLQINYQSITPIDPSLTLNFKTMALPSQTLKNQSN